jgi:alpha-amylase
MPWGDRPILPGTGEPRDEALRESYRRLIQIRRHHPALWRGGHTGLVFDEHLLVFARQDTETGDAVVVAINRGEEPATARFPAPAPWSGAAVLDLWSGNPVSVSGDTVGVSVAGREAMILGVEAVPGSEGAGEKE